MFSQISKKELINMKNQRRASFRKANYFKYKIDLLRHKKCINTKLLEEITEAIYSIINEKKRNINIDDDNAIFYLVEAPKINIYDFLLNIEKFTRVDTNVIICALIYIDRICNKREMNITKNNIHLLLSTAILISAKFNQDNFCNNFIYSQISGIPTKRLCMQESAFLEIIEYNLYISKKQFNRYARYLDYYASE